VGRGGNTMKETEDVVGGTEKMGNGVRHFNPCFEESESRKRKFAKKTLSQSPAGRLVPRVHDSWGNIKR